MHDSSLESSIAIYKAMPSNDANLILMNMCQLSERVRYIGNLVDSTLSGSLDCRYNDQCLLDMLINNK